MCDLTLLQHVKHALTGCVGPYPDLANNDLLNGGVRFDAIFVQFYNNYCGL